MNLGPIVFERVLRPGAAAQGVYIADNPVIELAPGEHVIERHAAQRSELRERNLSLAGNSALFGPSLEWACSAFIVHRHTSKHADDSTFGSSPPQPVQPEQPAQADPGRPRSRRGGVLYLFNVLVALEWIPDSAYMTRLEWSFRRASDFLFDITDGCMAFGQVTFGGRELMDCADVQILASNRLHPRSWVSGFHEPEKYTPVRLGRGMWSRRNQTTIGWDEPEGYRALIHEWAHYALCLRDRYLRPEERALEGRAMVLPDCAIASSTIMATLEGTSELVPHRGDGGDRKSDWKRMRLRFRSLPVQPLGIAGPGALPLPLPVFHRAGSLEDDAPASITVDRSFLDDKALRQEPDRCWIYCLRMGESAPQQLLALGTLEARAGNDIPLYGAFPDDQVIAIFQSEAGRLQQLRGIVEKNGTVDLRVAEPASALVDVVPHIVDGGAGNPNSMYVAVRIKSDTPPESVWVFPLGGNCDALDFGRPDSSDWLSETQLIPTLDGHVLLRWAGGRVQVATFSQGGGPPTHGPIGFSPVTAGSSNGNLMIFFRDEDWHDPEDPPNGRAKKKANTDYSEVKVVTTLLPGVDPRLPGRFTDATRGYVYSLAASTALPLELTPTLVMYYDAQRRAENVTPRIYHEVDGHWEELACYPSPRCGYVAVPLDEVSAPRLVVKDPDGPRVERYRIVWA